MKAYAEYLALIVLTCTIWFSVGYILGSWRQVCEPNALNDPWAYVSEER